MKRNSRQKGFTLIELLVTIGILGILAAVVVPNVGRFVGSGGDQAAATELTSVQTAMDSAMADLGLKTVVANAGPITNFTSGGGGPLDAGNTIYLSPDYLRPTATGGANISYSWDANGLVAQCNAAGDDCGARSWK
jgi:type IV pilus assembly protein PilA